MLTHNNIIYSEDQFNKAVGITKDDIMFMPAPLSHATGFHHGIISPMLVGGKLVLQQRFIRSESVEIMNREKCTYSMGATPFIFDLLKELEESERQIDSLKFYLCGGAPVPGHLIKRAWDLHRILVCEVYDSTESVPHVLVRPENALENDGANAGTAIPGTEIRIVDEHRNPLPPGVIGEEASRGPAVFVGYLNNQAVTEQALDNDGWFYSGDLAVMDELGQLKITDRKKDLIIRGGENLNINDIANALAGCPGMDDCAIVGMPDDRLGERICAYLEPSVPGTVITKEAVIAFLASKQVSKRFWPERIEMADHIPRTESGKVARYLLVADIKKKLAVESV